VFTGLIQTTGKLQEQGANQLSITYSAKTPASIFADLALGDSVAVDGVCLTVVEVSAQGFVADISPETLKRTTLSHASQQGTSVNLETSLRVGSKVGGHFVTGHIDGVGYLQEMTQTANAWELDFTLSDCGISRHIVPKGSITVNGVSLTVATCDAQGTWFKVAVIPHTFKETNLHQLQPGQAVNLEGDILSKYVERLVRLGTPRQGLDPEADSYHRLPGLTATEISPTFLAEHGYR
jgi:riboflavin synthase